MPSWEIAEVQITWEPQDRKWRGYEELLAACASGWEPYAVVASHYFPPGQHAEGFIHYLRRQK